MTKTIVPPETKLAAKQAFLRTALQGYEGVLAAGLSVNLLLAIFAGEFSKEVIIATAAVAILSPLISGLRSWVSITRQGIPEAYATAVIAEERRGKYADIPRT